MHSSDRSASPRRVVPAETFTLFRFALAASSAGEPRQETEKLGDYERIEEAFSAARACAERAAVAAMELVPTEFGYDLKQDFRTLVRYWIHARPSA